MEDKNYMETLLNASKGMCEVLLHGTIEASTNSVNSTMKDSLFDALYMQKEIYTKMEAKGWYKTDVAPAAKIQTTANNLKTN